MDANENKARVVVSDRATPADLRDFMPKRYLTSDYQAGRVEDRGLVPFAEAVKYAEYYRKVATVGKMLLQQAAPELYRDFPVKVTFDPLIDPSRVEGAAYQDPTWQEDGGIVYKLGQRPVPGGEWEEQVPAFSRFPKAVVNRGVRDVMYFVHEYTHLIMDKQLWSEVRGEVREVMDKKYLEVNGKIDTNRHLPADLNMASRALDEGLAVLVERLVAGEVKGNFDKYGLSQSEAGDVQKFVDMRTRAMQQNQFRSEEPDPVVRAGAKRGLAYNEGYELWRRVFNDNGGMVGVVEVLRGLDSVKVSVTERSDPRYLEVMKQPAKLLGLFGKKN